MRAHMHAPVHTRVAHLETIDDGCHALDEGRKAHLWKECALENIAALSPSLLHALQHVHVHVQTGGRK